MMVWSAMLLGLGLAIMVLASPSGEAQPPADAAPPTNDITCQQAVMDLLPCQPFLTAKGAGSDKPTTSCCTGVGNVFQQANTTQIRRDLCECFKKAAAALRIMPDRAKQIPDLCKIEIKIPIDPKVDCSK